MSRGSHLCPVCGLLMDRWLADNNYDAHILCEGKPTRVTQARQAREAALAALPVRPYTQGGQPSAGHSGTDTSAAAEPIRAESQKQVLAYLQQQGEWGATVAEVREATGLHHGMASGALSVLDKRGFVVMTTRKRGRCRIYEAVTW